MPRPMRYFSGRDPFRNPRGYAYICARSKAEAVRIGQQAFGANFSKGELDGYWSECWGAAAEQVLGKQEEPGAFLSLWKTFFRFVGKEE